MFPIIFYQKTKSFLKLKDSNYILPLKLIFEVDF